jgi:hypothetical protein
VTANASAYALLAAIEKYDSWQCADGSDMNDRLRHLPHVITALAEAVRHDAQVLAAKPFHPDTAEAAWDLTRWLITMAELAEEMHQLFRNRH